MIYFSGEWFFGAMSQPYVEGLYHEIPAGYYDRVYRHGRGVQSYWHEHRFRTVGQLLPSAYRRILDVGCGPGTFLGNFAIPSAECLGLDLATAQIDYAQRTYGRPGLEFRAADARSLDLAQRFDAVVSIEVIEHLPPTVTRSFLRTLFELLEPGGTAVLTTPNYRSAWRLLEPLVSIIGPVDYRPQHINRFDARRLAAELSEAGFVDVRVDSFYVVAPFAAALSRRLADGLLRSERALLPSWGAELAARGRRPG